jgi:hypothetical protein
MLMPTFPLTRLGAFQAELHACFTRRADALFELGDALLCAPAVPSLPHLSLEPVHQRGRGSAYSGSPVPVTGTAAARQLSGRRIRCAVARMREPLERTHRVSGRLPLCGAPSPPAEWCRGI